MAIAVQDLDAGLLEDLSRAQVQPLAVLFRQRDGEPPASAGRPYIWRWRDIYPLLVRTSEALDVGDDSERRALLQVNPDLPFGTTHTLTASFQLVKPGEITPTHRHTPSAIRFIVQGNGAFTTVSGERIWMDEGDLALTPNWTWHDHGNGTAAPVVWMDGIDSPLLRLLRAYAFEKNEERQEVVVPAGHTARQVGSGLVRPARTARPDAFQAVHYRWSDTYPRLQDMRESDPFDAIALEYVNPLTNGPVLPTISCWLQRLDPGIATEAHRHTSSSVYRVVSGRGYSVIDGCRFDWEKGDSFVVPSWRWHEHTNDGDDEAILFSVNDQPVMDALGLYREEPHPAPGGHQPVVSSAAGNR